MTESSWSVPPPVPSVERGTCVSISTSSMSSLRVL
jgi:hypothetical protein